MTIATKSIEETVNGLIEICRDGQQGFDAAVRVIENGELKTELREFSGRWSEFAAQLSGAMEQMGLMPHVHGSFIGAMRHGWIHLMKMVPGNTDHAVLTVCEREVSTAVEDYADAIDGALPDPIAALVAKQYETIRATHDRLCGMRDAADRH
jgi:uncharacterized protein (TIGR02284 family)